MLQKKSFPTSASVEAILVNKELVNQVTLQMMNAVKYLEKTCVIPEQPIVVGKPIKPDYQSAELKRGYDCPMNRQAVENAKFIMDLYDTVMEPLCV